MPLLKIMSELLIMACSCDVPGRVEQIACTIEFNTSVFLQGKNLISELKKKQKLDLIAKILQCVPIIYIKRARFLPPTFPLEVLYILTTGIHWHMWVFPTTIFVHTFLSAWNVPPVYIHPNAKAIVPYFETDWLPSELRSSFPLNFILFVAPWHPWPRCTVLTWLPWNLSRQATCSISLGMCLFTY